MNGLPYDQSERLRGVNPILGCILIMAAVRFHDQFDGAVRVRFTEGLRSQERQNQLFKEGKSGTTRSYHKVGRAVDVAIFANDTLPTWDVKWYERYNAHVQAVAADCRQMVTWGGLWKSVDAVHFQLELVRNGKIVPA